MKGNNNNNNKKSGKKKGSSKGKETPIKSTKYLGPIDTPAFKESSDLHTFLLIGGGTVTSDSGGVINTVFDPSAQCTSDANWSSYTSLFKEWRILALKVRFLPSNRYSKSGVVTNPIITITDRTGNSVLASLAAALNNASALEFTLDDPWERVVRMDSIEEANFVLTSSAPASASRFYIKTYASGLTNSTVYGQFMSFVVIQMRGTT